MEPIKPSGCCCAKPITDEEAVPKNIHWGKISSIAFLGLGLWFVIYQQLEPFSSYLTYSLFGIKKGSHLGASMQFFVYDTPKVMMLLTLIVFITGIIRSFFTQEQTRKYLAGKRETAGNVMAALLGIVTPFCSCSADPSLLVLYKLGYRWASPFLFSWLRRWSMRLRWCFSMACWFWKVAAIYLFSGLFYRNGFWLDHRQIETRNLDRGLGAGIAGWRSHCFRRKAHLA